MEYLGKDVQQERDAGDHEYDVEDADGFADPALGGSEPPAAVLGVVQVFKVDVQLSVAQKHEHLARNVVKNEVIACKRSYEGMSNWKSQNDKSPINKSPNGKSPIHQLPNDKLPNDKLLNYK